MKNNLTKLCKMPFVRVVFILVVATILFCMAHLHPATRIKVTRNTPDFEAGDSSKNTGVYKPYFDRRNFVAEYTPAP